jgi:hypothetical protein
MAPTPLHKEKGRQKTEANIIHNKSRPRWELKSSIPISAIIEISLKAFTLGAKAEEK